MTQGAVTNHEAITEGPKMVTEARGGEHEAGDGEHEAGGNHEADVPEVACACLSPGSHSVSPQ